METGVANGPQDDGLEIRYSGCFLLSWVLLYPIAGLFTFVAALSATRPHPFGPGRGRLGAEGFRNLIQGLHGGPVHEAVPWLLLVALIGVGLASALVLLPMIRLTGRLVDRASSLSVPLVGRSVYWLAWLIVGTAGLWVPVALMIVIVETTPL